MFRVMTMLLSFVARGTNDEVFTCHTAECEWDQTPIAGCARDFLVDDEDAISFWAAGVVEFFFTRGSIFAGIGEIVAASTKSRAGDVQRRQVSVIDGAMELNATFRWLPGQLHAAEEWMLQRLHRRRTFRGVSF